MLSAVVFRPGAPRGQVSATPSEQDGDAEAAAPAPAGKVPRRAGVKIRDAHL